MDDAVGRTVHANGSNHPQIEQLQFVTSSKSRRCNDCEEDFSNQAAFGRHLKTKKHADRSGTEYTGAQLQCSTCNKTFSRKSDRSRHEQEEHLGRKEPCPVCKTLIRPDYNTLITHLQSKACSQAGQAADVNIGNMLNASIDPIKRQIDQLADSFSFALVKRFEAIMEDSFAAPKDQPDYASYLEMVFRGKLAILWIEKQVQADELDDHDPFLPNIAWHGLNDDIFNATA